MSTTSERHAPGHHDQPPVRISVTVNDDRVVLSEHRLSGAQIKAVAVEQGADLQVGFQLSVKRGHRFHVVDDDEVITVHEHDEFVAVAADDNS
ncbi:multiubiquitin domain-containing protein [Amycolatopsis sp. WQ 127309]|uniref:multiubiquitin domain-containing protein n=1 Tax=Amycolatopsis sp. WQ 127309 TaxID=2932773 RepID=UPI001FF459FB|nr:multiubiquitin domain-containing protein [Amycolatopsis sp. WQ 127309]UOZ03493.1 multiubiquitin domain-containing protein [Amycolatopsis sp. WQ 127309]